MIETDDLPRQHGDYFLKDGNYSLDTYWQIYDKFILVVDFNLDETDPIL